MAPTAGLDGNFHHCRLPSPSALSQIHSTSQAQTRSDDGPGSNWCNQAIALRTLQAYCLGTSVCIAQAFCRSSNPAACGPRGHGQTETQVESPSPVTSAAGP